MNFIDTRTFFKSLKISWIKRYATERLHDHLANIIDRQLKLTKRTRVQILRWGPEALTCMISNNFPCIKGFSKAWLDFITSFHFRPTNRHKTSIFFNPWILQNPSVKDFAEYGKKKAETKYLKPELFGLSNNDCIADTRK